MEPEVVDLTTVQICEKIFNYLQNVGGIEASAVASRDGLLICSNMPQNQNAETFAAMAATMLGAAETVTAEIRKGIPNRVIVESEQGRLITVGAGSKALIVVIVDSNTGLGLILLELDEAAKKLKELLA